MLHPSVLSNSSPLGVPTKYSMANHPQSATEQEALELIDNASLPHPSACLLGAFVYDALNPDAAANYILKACHGNADSQAVLHALVSDWKYIVDSCLFSSRLSPSLLLADVIYQPFSFAAGWRLASRSR